MSAALTAQPGLHSTATAVSTKAKVNGKNKKRKKSTMAGKACATVCMVKSWIDIGLTQDTIGSCATTGGILKIEGKWFCERR